MNRESLVGLRRTVYEEYRKRVQLGEFDTNAGSILLCLHTLVDVLDHTLEEMKKAKNVHQASSNKTVKPSTR
jgi:hypothetical protein